VDLPAIDWSAPWLAPYRALGEPVTRAVAAGLPLFEALNGRVAQPPRFVDQAALPAGEPYEAFIARTGCVPTRSLSHDLFNALVWRVHPRLKTHLNALQAEQIERVGVGPVRGAVRDALTLFDENAAWLQAPAPLIDALRQRDWPRLFVTDRALWRDTRLVLFGHALLDKLLQPRKAITAHVWVVPLDVADPAAWLVERLTPGLLARKPWLPLPVLGVPGWWNSNEQIGFYDDAAVFRRPLPTLKKGAPTA
jgi:hypothetical protein